jgi:alkanesulfonate monooxygenase SsuD/methylene tetrahydromethanopterin reductase-like flavin-dependent oxidoreductase (luciferase family)
MRFGYLLPTREQIIERRPEALSLLRLAERAARLDYASLWVGDSLLARPRHEPLTLLAGVAARVPRVAIGTAVLLPALRNPVLLAHQVATLDQIAEGRLILGVGIARDVASIRDEFAAAGVPFEKRVGRLIEGIALARTLWRGEPVDWNGRWTLKRAVLAPTPSRPGGPPIWLAGSLPASLERAGRYFDGWIPNAGAASRWAAQWAEVKKHAASAGRNPDTLTGAMYLTVSIDEDVELANRRLDSYLERYYEQPAAQLRARQECYARTARDLPAYLRSYAEAGVAHAVLRFPGEHERHLDILAGLKGPLEAPASSA